MFLPFHNFDKSISFLSLRWKRASKNKLDALADGVFLTRDLVSEPGNILHPDEYAKRIAKLKKIGIKVTIYDKKKFNKAFLLINTIIWCIWRSNNVRFGQNFSPYGAWQVQIQPGCAEESFCWQFLLNLLQNGR